MHTNLLKDKPLGTSSKVNCKMQSAPDESITRLLNSQASELGSMYVHGYR